MGALLSNPIFLAAILAPTITGIMAIWLSNRNARAARQAAAEAKAKEVETDEKLATIQVFVDGRLSAATEEIRFLREEVLKYVLVSPTPPEAKFDGPALTRKATLAKEGDSDPAKD